ncbi:hypothetical protein QYE76_043985 [Lolium multiflorum]|uniref:Uncharacterized protein n=1 Tax=Lolium multiflorum TaxID=4521 RepID=A0AAD8TK19_LOLMU|nr:hypothetical protein QYE76_043985 [Lolium multiflorum]
MLKCPNHELPGNIIIDNFYARLSFQDKTLLDTTCSGSFTSNKEEFKRDLLDRIKENAEDWENDKGKESGYADKPPFKPLPPKEGNEEKEEKKKKKKGTKKKKKKKENKKKELRFEFDEDQEEVKHVLNSLFSDCLRQYRSRLKKKYFTGKITGSVPTISPFKQMTDKQWGDLVKHWSDPKNMPEDLVQDEATANLLRDLYPYASQQPHGYHKKPLFHDLIEDAKRLVAPGSVVSRFELIVKLLHDKSYQGITNKAFNAVAKTYSDALPGAGLPKSFYEVKQYIKVLGLGYEKIDFCKNNCALFWMEYNDLDECPVCKESRWKHDGAGGKKKIPWKVLRYFPLVQRLQRLFASEQTSRETRWHKEILTPDPDLLRHPADGDEWKQFDLDHPDFAADPRNLRLGLATDGFNPFGNMSNSYSMWPVLVTPYNQAPWTCTDQSNCMMALLIPGIPAHDGEVDFTVEVSIVDKEMDKLKLPGESQEENGQDEQDETMHEYQNEDGGDDDDDDDDDD